MKEHFGSEPPDDGWVYDGAGKWVHPGASPEIAIVGGGPGGLFTAYILNQRMPNAKITIFEATERCGGKIDTDRFSDGTPFEAGVAELYQYLGPGGDDPLRLLIEEDLGLETIDIAGGGVMMNNEIVRDLDEVEAIFGYDSRKRIDAFHKKMVEWMPLERYATRWQPDNEHPCANITFRECIEEQLKTTEGVDEAARDYIEVSVHSDLATESHTCNGLNGIKNVLMDNDNYMQLYHVVGGIERVVDELLNKIVANVRTSTRVLGVSKSSENSKYKVSTLEIGKRTLKEKDHIFDAVIVAIPNHWLRMIEWEGALAEAIHKTCAHYDLPAHYLRVSILFKTKWWEGLNMPGEFWMMDMFHGCCCYDESTRWAAKEGGHVLSFLLAGGDALLMCAFDQSHEDIVDHLLQSLPESMREQAEEQFVEAQVNCFVGSINAQPGGWPAEELRGEHLPEPNEYPGVFLVGDYFFDSTLNAALMSANVAAELLLEHFGEETAPVTKAIEQLESDHDEL